MRAPPPRRRAERRGLRLWPVGTVLVLAFAAAVVVAAAVFFTAWDLLGARGLEPERRIDSTTLFDLVKLSFGVVAGAGALVALVVAYRRQRVDEDGALREATRLHTERFTTAVSQLGEESAAVRLGGVHALAGLADDAPTRALRQTCIDVLCAYLQLPFTPDPGTDPAHQEEHHRYLAFRKVRHTILRLIGDHYRRPRGTHRSWQGCDLDLTGVTIDTDMDFQGVTFSGGSVSFRDARFSGSDMDFQGATFSGGEVSFLDATFRRGYVYFSGATFSGGEVSFTDATFSGSSVYFNDATFSDGEVSFGASYSTGGVSFSSGSVAFVNARFSGGNVVFSHARFSGGSVFFSHATFSGGEVSVTDTTFSSGHVSFNGATFDGGEVSFRDATFSGGEVDFRQARFFSGMVRFRRPMFSGGEVRFDDASGAPPTGLVPLSGSPLPTGLSLPPAWYPDGS